jgi:hypothetical protein
MKPGSLQGDKDTFSSFSNEKKENEIKISFLPKRNGVPAHIISRN